MFDWAYLIPLAPFIMVSFIVWLKHSSKLEEKRIEATASQSAEKAAQYAAQIQQLEDRVRVLERIVTDRDYDIATQIEALRDTVAVEQQGSGIKLDIKNRERA